MHPMYPNTSATDLNVARAHADRLAAELALLFEIMDGDLEPADLTPEQAKELDGQGIETTHADGENLSADALRENIEQHLQERPLDVVTMAQVDYSGEVVRDGRRTVEVSLTINGPTIDLYLDHADRVSYGTSDTPSDRYVIVEPTTADADDALTRFIQFIAPIEF